jgi:hypothetical protein
LIYVGRHKLNLVLITYVSLKVIELIKEKIVFKLLKFDL